MIHSSGEFRGRFSSPTSKRPDSPTCLPAQLFTGEQPVPASREPKTLNCHRGQRRQTIVQSLLADVFQGRLRAGEHLVTQELAQRFGVSHTPIREALITLAGIGIIDLLPNRGAVVRRVTPHEIREVYQVRRVLECEAARSACGRIDLAQLHALAADLRRMIAVKPRSEPRFIQEARATDSRLHDLIADSCGNAFLAQEIARLKALFRAFRDVAWERSEERNDFHRLAEEAREHLAIVEALLAGDAKTAARAMARHIRSGARYWSRELPAEPNGKAKGGRVAPRLGRPSRSDGTTQESNGRSTKGDQQS
jgi:DNA-binding GntR family transcriptional regulator